MKTITCSSLTLICKQQFNSIQFNFKCACAKYSKHLAGSEEMASGNERLQAALEELQGGQARSVRAVAQKYSIPKSTLHDHLKGKAKKVGAGGPTVFSPSEEGDIVLACTTLSDMGYGMTRDLVDAVIFDYLKDTGKPNPFTGGVPGRSWWRSFLKRWPILRERKPQHLSKKRAKAGNPDIINAWFDKLDSIFSEAGLDPHDAATACRLWNCDETAFCTSPTASKILARRGCKNVHEVGGGSGHQHITVHCAGSAAGERLPPFILYKGKNLYRRWTEGGPAGALYGANESGWMDAESYLSWFSKLFIPAVSHLTKTGPVVLIQDGHHSHISLELIRKARENHIILLCLPPNTTHLLQPFDLAVFSPLKKAWRAILKQYKLETRGDHASKEAFPGLISKLWETSLQPSHCRGGFRGAGLAPYSREHVLQKLPLVAAVSEDTDTAITASQDTATQDTAHDAKNPEFACSCCGHEIAATPIVKRRILGYFAGILEVQKGAPQVGKRNNLRIRMEGEAITSDEFQTILEEMEAEKKKKGGKKSRKRRNKKDGKLL